jgi:hypothetical protein
MIPVKLHIANMRKKQNNLERMMFYHAAKGHDKEYIEFKRKLREFDIQLKCEESLGKPKKWFAEEYRSPRKK